MRRQAVNPIYIPATALEDWKQLLADPEKHWKPGYSAVAVATAWHEATGFPAAIAKAFRDAGEPFRSIEPLLIIPEHRVPLPGGSRPSQTDVWVLGRHATELISIGVEAKVSESFGPTVGEWLINASEGKRERLAYIKHQLGLRHELPPITRYQLLHRCASAIIEAQRFHAKLAILLVQSFSREDTGFDDFCNFTRLFTPKNPRRNEFIQLGAEHGVSFYSVWVNEELLEPGSDDEDMAGGDSV